MYDGNGDKIKTVRLGTNYCPTSTNHPYPYPCANLEKKSFRIRSSIINETVAEIESLKTTLFSNNSISESINRQTHIYGNGKEIAERRIWSVGTIYITDKTLLKSTDASGVEQTEVVIRNDGTGHAFGGQTVSSDPFGSSIGFWDVYPAPPSSGYPSRDDPNCEWHGDLGFDCAYPEDYEDPEYEEGQAGSVPQNTCYVDGVEADCNHIADNPDLYESNDVALDDSHSNEAPSERGPQGVWDDDDSSNDDSGGDAGETEFEQQYNGKSVWFNEGTIAINVSASMPHLNTWDLRTQTGQRDRGRKVLNDYLEKQKNKPIQTGDTQIYDGPPMYKKPVEFFDLLLEFLKKNPACEAAFNAQIAGVAAFTGKKAVEGGIRGSIKRFITDPYSKITMVKGFGGGNAGTAIRNWGESNGRKYIYKVYLRGIGLTYQNFGDSQHLLTTLSELSHLSGMDDDYSDDEMARYNDSMGIFVMSPKAWLEKHSKFYNQYRDPKLVVDSAFAQAWTNYVCSGVKELTLK